MRDFKTGDKVRVKGSCYHDFADGTIGVIAVVGTAACIVKGITRAGESLFQTIRKEDLALASDNDCYGKTSNISKIYVNEAKRTVAVKFVDGDVKVVHCSEGDSFDVYVGVSLALARKLYGTAEKFHKIVDKKRKD